MKRRYTTTVDEVKYHYEKRVDNYEAFCKTVQRSVERLLNQREIDFLGVDYRVKSFNSIWDKHERQKTTEPLSDIDDICGIRIVCFYLKDLDKIESIIQKEFEIIRTDRKDTHPEPEKFGYRSRHFVIKIKKEWLHAPDYRGFESFRAEIQVRTILMHSWADISHKLAYKKEEDIPIQFQRKLNQLSALFEIADKQFDDLHGERQEYKRKLTLNFGKGRKFDFTQDLNVDSLQSFMEYAFPNQRSHTRFLSDELDDLKENGIGFPEILHAYKVGKRYLIGVERDCSKAFKRKTFHFAPIAAVRILLKLVNDKYWKGNQSHMAGEIKPIVNTWRKKLKASK